MATWQSNVPITGSSGTAYLEIDTQVYTAGTTGWSINYQIWYRVRGGWNIARNASGGGNASWSNGGPWGSSGVYPADYEIYASSFSVGCDVNGNGSYGLTAHINMDSNSPYNTIDASGSEGTPRIALGPGFATQTVDTIKTTSARLGATLANYGHGTSATIEMFYRVHGIGSYVSLGVQGYSGSNYWSATGLTPNTTYDYICNTNNNNGDFGQSGIQTFTTQAASGMISVMNGII